MDLKDLKQIAELVKAEFEIHDEKWEAKMLEWKSEIINAVDAMAGEIRDERDFREIISGRTSDNTERIEKLEKKVFGVVAEG